MTTDGKKPTSQDKWRWTLLTVIIFIIVINPLTYIIVNKIFNIVGLTISSTSGCPTLLGLTVHTVVFTLLLRYIMEFDI